MRIAAGLEVIAMNHESTPVQWTRPMILVVDDEAAEREQICILLEDAGYDVLEAVDGKEAESVLGVCMVDLMITDIVMPEQEGLQTIKSVRKNRPHLKIIAMSGVRVGGHLRAAELLGADAVLCKPLTREVLLDAVAALLPRGETGCGSGSTRL